MLRYFRQLFKSSETNEDELCDIEDIIDVENMESRIGTISEEVPRVDIDWEEEL